MIRALALILALLLPSAAHAHPHVWVTMTSEVLYAPDGTMTGVRHAWTFDDMFSTFATQGLESKEKGKFTRAELQPLAEINVTSLKEYEYFNQARASGKKIEFVDPKDYFLEQQKDGLLTLHFTLPLKTPAPTKTLDLEVYDPSYFVDFSFAEKDAVALNGAPKGCAASAGKPADSATAALAQRLSQIGREQQLSGNVGAQFANKIAVKCP